MMPMMTMVGQHDDDDDYGWSGCNSNLSSEGRQRLLSQVAASLCQKLHSAADPDRQGDDF